MHRDHHFPVLLKGPLESLSEAHGPVLKRIRVRRVVLLELTVSGRGSLRSRGGGGGADPAPSRSQPGLRESERVAGRVCPDPRERDEPPELPDTQDTHHHTQVISNHVSAGIREETQGSETQSE